MNIYSIRNTPEDVVNYNVSTNCGTSTSYVVCDSGIVSYPNNSFAFKTPIGDLSTILNSSNAKEKIEANRNLINRNIEYLEHVNEIFDYIEKIEKQKKC
jgi:hypothetical protein